jgi:hypothetical protein
VIDPIEDVDVDMLDRLDSSSATATGIAIDDETQWSSDTPSPITGQEIASVTQ